MSMDPGVLVTCRICNGSGKQRGKDIGPCLACKGTGLGAVLYTGLYTRLKKDD
jgi:DnaJ-class molecular chaperone